jgi:chromosome segregation ATPase
MSTEDQPDNRYRSQLVDLEKEEVALEQEMHQLQHEFRRMKDGLERAGGVQHELEQKARQLRDNISLCEYELNKNRQHQSDGSEQLNDMDKTKKKGL